MSKYNIKDEKEFYKAILSLSTIEECKKFFDDICTIQEIEAISQRLQVAKQLSLGKSYIEINKTTGASTATICRVSKSLNYGDGGYNTVLKRIAEE